MNTGLFRQVKLSVVIPAYNEECRIPCALDSVMKYLSGRYDFEIIVVDDGSSDGTAEICSAFFESGGRGKLLRNSRNRGKGYSVRRGMLEAGGDLILFSDADMSTPITEAEKLIESIGEGFDVAVGSRGLPESDVRVRQPFIRESMGRCFNVLVRMFSVRGIRDTQCGFKLFSRECARKVFEKSRIDRFSFDVEALFLARMFGYKTAEVPVTWINSESSRVSVLRDPLKMFLDILYIRFIWLSGGYV